MKKSTGQLVIVLGCHKIGLGIIRALGEAGVHVIGVSYSKMDMGNASKYVVRAYHFPHPDKEPEKFLNKLVSLYTPNSKTVLIPSDDAALICVSKHIEMLSRLFKVASCGWDIIKPCIIKKYTYDLAERLGIPCPQTKVPKTLEEVRQFGNKCDFPCLVKPTIGHSFYEIYKKKMILVQNASELEKTFADLNKARIEIMLQEYIPGDDQSGVNYNSFYHHGEKVIELTAQKIRLSPPRIGFPRVVISKDLPELSAPASKLLSALKYDGVSCIEFKKDQRDGVYKLMEINARLNLSTPLSVLAGVNFPYLLYKYTLTGEIPKPITDYRKNIYWIDPGKDIIESLKNFRKEKSGIRDYLLPYFKPHAFSILSSSDLMPFIKRCINIGIEVPFYLIDKSKSYYRNNRSVPL